MSPAHRYARLSQINLAGWILLCIVLAPEFFFSFDQGGVSNHGVIALTALPYTLAFLSCSYFMFRSASKIPKNSKTSTELRLVINTVAVFFLLLLVSTYIFQINRALELAHQSISITTVALLYIVGWWFYKITNKNKISGKFLAVQSLGFLLAVLTMIDVVRLLFLAQIIFAVGFGGLYVNTIRRLDAIEKK